MKPLYWIIIIAVILILGFAIYSKAQKNREKREAQLAALAGGDTGEGDGDGKGKTNIWTVLGIIGGTAALTSGAWWLFGKNKDKNGEPQVT